MPGTLLPGPTKTDIAVLDRNVYGLPRSTIKTTFLYSSEGTARRRTSRLTMNRLCMPIIKPSTGNTGSALETFRYPTPSSSAMRWRSLSAISVSTTSKSSGLKNLTGSITRGDAHTQARTCIKHSPRIIQVISSTHTHILTPPARNRPPFFPHGRGQE